MILTKPNANLTVMTEIKFGTIFICMKSTFHIWHHHHYISRESKPTRNVLWSRASVCVSVCPRSHANTIARTRMWLGGMVGDAP